MLDDAGGFMRQLTHRQAGFTLIELGVTITIIGLLAMAAMPALSSFLANSQLREAANVVVANAMWARSEAIKLNATTTLRVTGRTLQISTTDSSAPALLRSVPIPSNVQAADFSASFDSAGRLTPFGSQLSLALSSPKFPCSEDIRCPAVRFDAGGVVSICAKGVCQ